MSECTCEWVIVDGEVGPVITDDECPNHGINAVVMDEATC